MDDPSSSESPSPAAAVSGTIPVPGAPPSGDAGAAAALPPAPDTVVASPAVVAGTVAQLLLTPEDKAAALEFREKLRIVKTVLEQVRALAPLHPLP